MLKLYIGSKLVQAEPMDEWAFLKEYKDVDNVEGKSSREGYKIVFSSKFQSWHPKKIFENAYREVTEEERYLFDVK